MSAARQRSFRTYFIVISVISIFFVALSLLVLQNPQYLSTPKSWYDKFTHKDQFNDEPPTESEFNDIKWGWQNELPEYDLPAIDKVLIDATATNWQGNGHETFATLYASREAEMDDPYFMAVQQIIYRILWRPESKTKKHTMTVFVLPFISQRQRDYFTAAGALVREVPEEVYHPDSPGAVPGRWRDMFSKLDMWNHTEFSKIAYLDSDAFPLSNIDSIFDVAKEQRCKEELLPPADIAAAPGLCDYIFAGWHDGISVNAGVLVFSPNELMHERLIRETHNHTKFDKGEMEQSLLNYAFRLNGPFPYQFLPRLYNGGTDTIEDGSRSAEEEYVIHTKLWNTQWEPETKWYKNVFNETWSEMLRFYETPEFRSARTG